MPHHRSLTDILRERKAGAAPVRSIARTEHSGEPLRLVEHVAEAPVSIAVPTVSLDEVARIVEEHSRHCGFERRCRVGEAIIKGLFGGSRLAWRAQGSTRGTSFRKLAELLHGRVSKSELHRAVTVHMLCQDLKFVPTSGHLTVSHADAVEGIPRAHQESLLRGAHEGRWSVQRLREEKRAVLAESRKVEGKRARGRPRSSVPQMASAMGRSVLRKVSEIRELLVDGAIEQGFTDDGARAGFAACLTEIRDQCADLLRWVEVADGPASSVRVQAMATGRSTSPPTGALG
jgi:hypothetical protein